MRPVSEWSLGSRTLELGRRTLVMGIVNVTPDSFSSGGRFLSPDEAIDLALGMLEEGADIVDIGGESTRPGARVSPNSEAGFAAAGSGHVSVEEELRRVLPVIRGIKRAEPEAVISIDTYKAEVARQAVEAGAEIVNDVSAFRWDKAMARTVASLDCGVVLMHMRGRPEQWRELPAISGNELLALVCSDLREFAQVAEREGVSRNRIVLDPGFGFGKNYRENYPLLARLGEIAQLGYPLLVGTSRKSFIGRTIARGHEIAAPTQRLYGTLATVTAAVLAGTQIVRVHDVTPTLETVAIADEIVSAS